MKYDSTLVATMLGSGCAMLAVSKYLASDTGILSINTQLVAGLSALTLSLAAVSTG